MRYFIIESEFQKPFKEFGNAASRHREYLQTFYDQDMLLCSGPNTTKTGEILVGKASVIEQIEAMISGDPYRVDGLATYSIKQFDPAMKADILCNW